MLYVNNDAYSWLVNLNIGVQGYYDNTYEFYAWAVQNYDLLQFRSLWEMTAQQ